MKKNFKFIMVAAAALAMIGCAKDGGETAPVGVKAGEPTTATFTIQAPVKGGTRAAADPNATAVESKMRKAQVFLFDGSNRLEAKAELTVAVNGLSATNAAVRTTSGQHKIFVVVNAPTEIQTYLDGIKATDDEAAIPVSGEPLATFMAKTYDIPNAAGLDKITSAVVGSGATATLGFYMTGDKDVTFEAPTAINPNPTANSVSMEIGRAMAKVKMEISSSLIQPVTGTVNTNSFAYKVMNNPIKMYALKNVNATILSTPISGNGTARENYFSNKATFTPASTPIYAVENANVAPSSHNTTSLVIEGVFTPSSVKLANGSTDSSFTPGNDFYRVWDNRNQVWLPSFYSVSPTTAPVKDDAGIPQATEVDFSSTKHVTENNVVDPSVPNSARFFVQLYTDGKSYWRLPLEDELKGGNQVFNVARNDYYDVTIKSVSAVGAPSEDEVLPGTPDPLSIPVDISATITVGQWNVITLEEDI